MGNTKETKSAYLHMRVHPSLRDRIQAEARARLIDTSALVSLVLGEWLDANARAPRRLVNGSEPVDVRPPEETARE